MPSSCSLVTEDGEKRAPTGVHDGLREMVVLDHVRDLKVFYRNPLIALSIGLSRLEMMVTTLPIDLQV